MFKDSKAHTKLDAILKYLVNINACGEAACNMLRESFHYHQTRRGEIEELKTQINVLTQQGFFFRRFLEGLQKENPGKVLKYSKKTKKRK